LKIIQTSTLYMMTYCTRCDVHLVRKVHMKCLRARMLFLIYGDNHIIVRNDITKIS